jgi:DNA-binding winged helix-turn-helix (wHTH) protein/TolB-like protein/Flp pilus assembly protein TadD
MTGSEPPSLYEFAEFRLDSRRRLLARKTGESVELTGKAFDALLYLVEHAGQVVSRGDLMKAVWPRTVVEDNSLTQAISAVRRALGDDGGRQRLFVTLTGRGYQFVGTVGAISATELEAGRGPHTRAMAPHRSWTWRPILLGAGALILALAGSLAVKDRLGSTANGWSTAQSSLAVLPFRDLSSDANDAWLVAGLHEDLFARLSGIGGLTLIGRTSVMGYADADRPAPEIARELGASAVLEGTATRVADRVQVEVRLVSVDARVLLDQRYGGDLGDVFRTQGDVAIKIADALHSQLSAEERSRIDRRPTQSLEAYALYFRAIALYRAAGGIGPTMTADARQQMQLYFDKAIDLDGEFAAAYAWKAYLYVDSLFFEAVPEQQWAVRSNDWIERVQSNAARALRLDSAASVAHVARARLALFDGRLADAHQALERARTSNPNDSQTLQQMALLYSLRGDFPQAIAAARRGLELDPKNPGSYAPLEVALQLSGQADSAAAVAQAMVEAAPGAAIAYILLARAEIARGNEKAALEALRLAEGLGPLSPTVAIDLALSYGRLGQLGDAERLAAVFAESTRGLYVNPATRAAELLARGDVDGALRQARAAIESPGRGDPLSLAAIRWNIVSSPVLEQRQWRQLRSQMATR